MADIKGTGTHHDAASSSGDSNEKAMMKELDHPGMAAAVENIVGIPPASDLVFTKQEEDRVWRKLDYRLLPLVFVLYTLSVLDRSNLGNAKLAGLEDSIDLGGWRYNWLGTIFYIACTMLALLRDRYADCWQTSSPNGYKWDGNDFLRTFTVQVLSSCGAL